MVGRTGVECCISRVIFVESAAAFSVKRCKRVTLFDYRKKTAVFFNLCIYGLARLVL